MSEVYQGDKPRMVEAVAAPIVLVTQDMPQGRTQVHWYQDMVDWERGYPLAYLTFREAWIDSRAPAEVKRQAAEIFQNEMTRDPRVDLSWLATHRCESGLLVPIPERAA